MGKRARLCLAPVSLAYLSLFALAMSLALLLTNLQDQVNDAKTNLEVTCNGIEELASFAASVPHYAADVTNRATVATLNDTIKFTSTAINLIIDISEAYVRYAVNTINTPYVCLCEFIIRAALDVLIDAAKLIEGAVDVATAALVDGIKGAVDIANGFIKTIDKFGGNVKTVSVDTSSISNGVQKYFDPADWMETLNNSVPTLTEAENALVSLFDTPVEVVRTLATEALASSSANLSRSLFPIPSPTTLTFCSGLNTTFLDEVGDSVRKWAIWGLEGLAGGAVLLAFILALIEWASYSVMTLLIDRIRLRWFPDEDPTSAAPTTQRLLGFLQAVEHPILVVLLSGSYGAAIWFATYITYGPALLFLVVGVLGIGVIELQLYLLNGSVRTQAEAHISAGLDDLVLEIATKLNASLLSTSEAYAIGVNTELIKIQDSVNTAAFGWIQSGVTAVNNTIEGFVGNVESSVKKFLAPAAAWGDLVDNLINCVIGTELNEIETILKWLQTNAQVLISNVSSTQFVLSGAQVDTITSGLSGTSTGPTAIDSLVEQFITRYESVLRVQQYVFIGYAGVWGVVLLLGLLGLVFAEISLHWGRVRVKGVSGGGGQSGGQWGRMEGDVKGLFSREEKKGSGSGMGSGRGKREKVASSSSSEGEESEGKVSSDATKPGRVKSGRLGRIESEMKGLFAPKAKGKSGASPDGGRTKRGKGASSSSGTSEASSGEEEASSSDTTKKPGPAKSKKGSKPLK